MEDVVTSSMKEASPVEDGAEESALDDKSKEGDNSLLVKSESGGQLATKVEKEDSNKETGDESVEDIYDGDKMTKDVSLAAAAPAQIRNDTTSSEASGVATTMEDELKKEQAQQGPGCVRASATNQKSQLSSNKVAPEGCVATDIQPLPSGIQPLQRQQQLRGSRAGAYAVQSPRLNPPAINTTTGNNITTGDNVAADNMMIPDHDHQQQQQPHLIEAELVKQDDNDSTDEEKSGHLIMAEEIRETVHPTASNRRPRSIFLLVLLSLALAGMAVALIVVATNKSDGGSSDTKSDDLSQQNADDGSSGDENSGVDDATVNTTNFTISQDTTSNQNTPYSEDTTEADIIFPCFESTQELYDAVDAYYEDNSPSSSIAEKYGWPIGSWCVSNIRDFGEVLRADRNEFDLSEAALHAAEHFQDDIGDWDMSNAKDTKEMIRGVQNLSASWGIDRWDIRSMTSLEGIFMDTQWTEPQLDLSRWNTSNVRVLAQLFRWSSVERANIGTWDVSKVVSLSQFAERARNFQDDGIGEWNVESVGTMNQAFSKASSFNVDISRWNTISLTNMYGTFREATSFNQPLGSWNVSQVNDLGRTFMNASSFSQDLCAWGAQLAPDVRVLNMFMHTACPNTSDPIISEGGPFCFNCN